MYLIIIYLYIIIFIIIYPEYMNFYFHFYFLHIILSDVTHKTKEHEKIYSPFSAVYLLSVHP